MFRIVARALEPPDLHRTDMLPRYAPWGAVILARVLTYVAWALSVALVILVIGATVLAIGIATGRATLVPGGSSLGSQPFGDTLDRDGTFAQRVQLPGVQPLELSRQRPHPSCPSLGHECPPLRRRAKPHHASVVLIGLPRHESPRLEGAYQTRHRRRPHLLGRRELAQRERAGEDDDREC
jgi:hypothetical protein